uniref:Deltamethrin resistance protein prag01 domain-containing protein n=1 Tax=Schistocephalus solidus TaxID=70667 RepID=A0A0X3Q790_SCHSO
MTSILARSSSGLLKRAFKHIYFAQNAQSHVKPIRFPTVSYDDLTKPEGPWRERYDRMNQEYTRYMYYGLATFLVSTAITIYVADFGRYAEPLHRNTPEGLSFLNPDPNILEEIQN